MARLVVESGGKKFTVSSDVFATANVVLSDIACDPSVYIKAAVRMQSGIAYNAQADVLANSNVIGIVESKGSSTLCNIRVLGVTVGDIFTGLDETKEYYLSETVAGGLSVLPPVASGSVVLRIGQPFDSTNMLVIKGVRTIRS